MQGVKIETDEKATKAITNTAIDDEGAIQELGEKLTSVITSLGPGFKMTPIQFEKVGGVGMGVVVSFLAMPVGAKVKKLCTCRYTIGSSDLCGYKGVVEHSMRQ